MKMNVSHFIIISLFGFLLGQKCSHFIQINLQSVECAKSKSIEGASFITNYKILRIEEFYDSDNILVDRKIFHDDMSNKITKVKEREHKFLARFFCFDKIDFELYDSIEDQKPFFSSGSFLTKGFLFSVSGFYLPNEDNGLLYYDGDVPCDTKLPRFIMNDDYVEEAPVMANELKLWSQRMVFPYSVRKEGQIQREVLAEQLHKDAFIGKVIL